MFSKKIQRWYAQQGRELPWRETKDPYFIWVSEIILQQTRVNQGFNYYLRFINRFPTYQDLAKADEQEVLKYWQGLGYYSRARNMHTAARSIQGNFPTDYKDVLALKGVGEYTAAAICSFAYDQPYAVVDGNVYRVLSRYYGIDEPIDQTAGKKTFAALAKELLDKTNPATHNQAIMDFGALQCSPKSPNCMECPLQESCIAYNEKRINELPVKIGKTKITDRYFNFFFIDQGEYTYIVKREEKDIWKNLYQFPLIETKQNCDLTDILSKSNDLKLGFLKDAESLSIVVKDYKHILSHQRLHTNIYKAIIHPSIEIDNSFIKIKKDEFDQYPIPRLVHLFVKKLFEQ